MVPLRPLLTTLVLTTLALSASGAAQQATFRAGTRTVPVYATVTDPNGRLVPDLDRSHFEIYDNGKKQDVTLFENAIQPISVVVMLDTSGSMTMHLDLLKQAATQFVIRLLPDDRARVGSFSDRNKIRISPETFTNNRDELMRAVREDLQFGNPTALWDATDRSMDALAGIDGSTFTRVAQELHSQYVLGFSPQALDGKTHALEVRLTQPGLTARARRSYIAK